MKRLILVFILLLPLSVYSADKPRIIGGYDAPKTWESITSINYAGGYQYCGGTLIAPGWVLTAGHCVCEGDQPEDVELYVGEYNLAEPTGEYQAVEEFICHPGYNTEDDYVDIALIKISGESAKKPARLLASREPLAEPGAESTVIGWGNTSIPPETTYPDILKQVELPIVSNTVCNEVFSEDYDQDIIYSYEICAGFPEGGKDACQGDSGGPMFVRDHNGEYAQAGVVSWGNSCALEGYYGVYASVADNIEWIHSHVEGGFTVASDNTDRGNLHPAEITVTSENYGFAYVDNITLTGEGADNASLSFATDDTCGELPFALAAGESCGFLLRYSGGVEDGEDVILTVSKSGDPASVRTMDFTLSYEGEPENDSGGGGGGCSAGGGGLPLSLGLFGLLYIFRRRLLS
ncbi:S1 family peptidase [Limisalsivibrio acetivorans]|uniref:S1 family peptidase n=1 Tax=Limisalsivibrio acetivorans TaxID=1304888 RepID=UPI0003B5DC0C|nr:serine protease [Limisalsivibrio acetivorans]